jgi:hypothetical protein
MLWASVDGACNLKAMAALIADILTCDLVARQFRPQVCLNTLPGRLEAKLVEPGERGYAACSEDSIEHNGSAGRRA